ncbi:hypothetical protein GGX14DRAFT_396117 [Mycena pura]|uniref:Uncharacterized protein n=1 Tax=Mycena pura TaxID=153505 RepID=A0AAD6VC08_9AGAR|nr:hypothetical protein GGX14DRAFT_396117 [Mycena pura]
MHFWHEYAYEYEYALARVGEEVSAWRIGDLFYPEQTERANPLVNGVGRKEGRKRITRGGPSLLTATSITTLTSTSRAARRTPFFSDIVARSRSVIPSPEMLSLDLMTRAFHVCDQPYYRDATQDVGQAQLIAASDYYKPFFKPWRSQVCTPVMWKILQRTSTKVSSRALCLANVWCSMELELRGAERENLRSNMYFIDSEQLSRLSKPEYWDKAGETARSIRSMDDDTSLAGPRLPQHDTRDTGGGVQRKGGHFSLGRGDRPGENGRVARECGLFDPKDPKRPWPARSCLLRELDPARNSEDPIVQSEYTYVASSKEKVKTQGQAVVEPEEREGEGEKEGQERVLPESLPTEFKIGKKAMKRIGFDVVQTAGSSMRFDPPASTARPVTSPGRGWRSAEENIWVDFNSPIRPKSR